MQGLASQGRSTRTALSLLNQILELSSGNCVWQINHHWGFPPSYLCILIYSSFFPFHFGLGLASTGWRGCAISAPVSKSACSLWQSSIWLGAQLDSGFSSLQGRALSCVCRARDDSLLAWEGTKPSSPGWAGLHVKWKLSLFTNWSKWLCYWHRLHYVSHSILWKRGQKRKKVMAGRGKFHFFLNWVETSSGKLKKNPREEEQKK